MTGDQINNAIEAALPMLDEKARKALTFTRWHDGIDIEYPTVGCRGFVAAILLHLTGQLTDGVPVPQTPKENDLIENGKQQGAGLAYRYIDNASGGIPGWTVDPNEALRFARRADAEQYVHHDEDAWRIVEHGWLAGECRGPVVPQEWAAAWRVCAESICTMLGTDVQIGRPEELLAAVQRKLSPPGVADARHQTFSHQPPIPLNAEHSTEGKEKR